jgi:hypothetical protein
MGSPKACRRETTTRQQTTTTESNNVSLDERDLSEISQQQPRQRQGDGSKSNANINNNGGKNGLRPILYFGNIFE